MSEKRITEESRYAGLALAEEELVAREIGRASCRERV